MRACTSGDVAALRDLLAADPSLARARLGGGSTALHLAARHPEAVRLLIESGADPNARDLADNATPLHVAAANRSLGSVRLLLDAGADPRGQGDVHDGEVIGWASCGGNDAVIQLLLERGAKHHIFSAMARRDRELVERLVGEDPDALRRRRSRFEGGQSAVHAAFAPPDGLGQLAGTPDYEMLQLLIDLGADVEARDDKGRTPMDLAMLRGDREAMRLLKAAGARGPDSGHDEPAAPLSAGASSIRKGEPMFGVRDMRATIAWYEAIGFTVSDRYEAGGELMVARVSFGRCSFRLTPGGNPGPRDVSLWFYTDRVEALYRAFRQRQIGAARRALEGAGSEPDVRFAEDLDSPFYGGSQFSIEDINGLTLIFWQPPDLVAPSEPAS
jgi:ankyrin repeat protein